MFRALTMVAGLGLAQIGLAAEPIVLPDFTPGSADPFAVSVSVMVQGTVADRLLHDGHIVLTTEVIQPVVVQMQG